jgi:hypothetical protein
MRQNQSGFQYKVSLSLNIQKLMPDKEITKRKKMIYAITWYHFKFFHYVTHCTRQVQRIIYLAIVHLVPLPLRILHITYIMTRDGCIHDIMMDNHSIQAVHRAIILPKTPDCPKRKDLN